MKLNKTLLFLTLFALSIPVSALFTHAFALTATTSKTIQGFVPRLFAEGGLVPSDMNNILNFEVPTPTGSSIYYGNSSFDGVYFPQTLTINQFDVNAWNNYIDQDGDVKATTNWVTYTSLLTTWKDKNGNTPASNAHLNSCFGPYTLKIEATNLAVHSKYGNPSSNILGNLSKTFTINVEPDICFLKPSNMQWVIWTTPLGGPQLSNSDVIRIIPPPNNSGGAWDITQFDPERGFSAKISGDKFPTTGFIGASFEISASPVIWAGGYSFSSPVSLWYDVSSSGKVTLKQKPPIIPAIGVVTMTAAGRDPVTYTFTIKKWATPKNTTHTYAEAMSMPGCTLLDPSDYTNTAQALTANWLGLNNNVYTRQVGSFNGEWGALDSYTTSWMPGQYWTTGQTSGFNIPLINGIRFGSIVKKDDSVNKYRIACKD